MDETGVDFAMDVHGDEAIAANFLAGFEGILLEGGAASPVHAFDALVGLSPDFQTDRAIRSTGRARPISPYTAQLAERYGAVSIPQMQFKDNGDLPDPVYGWSPERCRLLAAQPRHASCRDRRGRRLSRQEA
jgi:hypothetical protein